MKQYIMFVIQRDSDKKYFTATLDENGEQVWSDNIQDAIPHRTTIEDFLANKDKFKKDGESYVEVIMVPKS